MILGYKVLTSVNGILVDVGERKKRVYKCSVIEKTLNDVNRRIMEKR